MDHYFEQFMISEDFQKRLNKQHNIDNREKKFIKLHEELQNNFKQLESRYDSRIKSIKQHLESTSR